MRSCRQLHAYARPARGEGGELYLPPEALCLYACMERGVKVSRRMQNVYLSFVNTSLVYLQNACAAVCMCCYLMRKSDHITQVFIPLSWRCCEAIPALLVLFLVLLALSIRTRAFSLPLHPSIRLALSFLAFILSSFLITATCSFCQQVGACTVRMLLVFGVVILHL